MLEQITVNVISAMDIPSYDEEGNVTGREAILLVGDGEYDIRNNGYQTELRDKNGVLRRQACYRCANSSNEITARTIRDRLNMDCQQPDRRLFNVKVTGDESIFETKEAIA